MQKEILYKFYNPVDGRDVSDYQLRDLAVYDVELHDSDIKQIKKLTKDQLTFNIPQININYCNSFNENYNITIQYAPIDVYDLGKMVTGEIDSGAVMVDQDGKNVLTADDDQATIAVNELTHLRLGDKDTFDPEMCVVSLQPQAHTFSLQQQSINSLVAELNYPLKHIQYQDSVRAVYQGNKIVYETMTNGEVDISKQVYWDTFNGKLRFNYKGVIYDLQTWGLYSKEGGYTDPTNFIGFFPTFNQYIPSTIDAGTYKYNYVQQWINRYWTPLDIFASGEESLILVKQLDSTKDNKIFYVDNFYWANQLMGFMQTPQRMFTFLEQYPTGSSYSEYIYPQTRASNYHLGLWCKNNDNKYLKNLSADFYLTTLASGDFPEKYNNRQVCLSKEFFLQLWREVYVMTPSLQSNTLLYKPENIRYDRLLYFTNTVNTNGKDVYPTGNQNENKEENIQYLFVDKLSTICYYVNSVSFNNYVSLQNNYPLQYSIDESFDIEALKDMTFILLDENGVILPRLSEFKVYLQFAQDQNNAAQTKTTNFNRVISDVAN